MSTPHRSPAPPHLGWAVPTAWVLFVGGFFVAFAGGSSGTGASLILGAVAVAAGLTMLAILGR